MIVNLIHVLILSEDVRCEKWEAGGIIPEELPKNYRRITVEMSLKKHYTQRVYILKTDGNNLAAVVNLEKNQIRIALDL